MADVNYVYVTVLLLIAYNRQWCDRQTVLESEGTSLLMSRLAIGHDAEPLPFTSIPYKLIP
jgi:hypothetical protein